MTMAPGRDSDPFILNRRGALGAGGLAGALALFAGLTGPVQSAAAASKTDDALLKAYGRFLDRLARTAEAGFKRSSASYPEARATGLLHILNNIPLGLAFNYHYADPMHPDLFHMMDPARKQGGDNADALYLATAVDPGQTYRLYGNLGTARYFSATTVKKGPPPFGGGMGAALYKQDIKTKPNGDFEIFMSSDPRPGNWLRLDPDVFRVTIRQFFADWENERPMDAFVERIGPPAPPAVLTAERMIEVLDSTAEWVEATVVFWQDMMDLFRKEPNRFISWREITGDKVNATPGGDPACMFWQIPQDKALILRTVPPKCQFWNFEFNDPWWQTHDYRYRRTGINMHSGVLEDDGELIVVVAHKDPGYANWLDTSGHTEGMMGRRWIFSDTLPEVTATLVGYDELSSHLPASAKRVTPAARAAQMAAQRRGVYKRFHWF